MHLAGHRVARVGADPSPGRAGGHPAGDRRISYLRLHGTPRMYYSAYSDRDLEAIAGRVEAASRISAAVWCLFDNTTLGAAMENALELQSRLLGGSQQASALP